MPDTKIPPFTEHFRFPEGLIRCEPGGFVLTEEFGRHAHELVNFKPRKDDVWVVTFPKCGNITFYSWSNIFNWFFFFKRNNVDPGNGVDVVKRLQCRARQNDTAYHPSSFPRVCIIFLPKFTFKIAVDFNIKAFNSMQIQSCRRSGKCSAGISWFDAITRRHRQNGFSSRHKKPLALLFASTQFARHMQGTFFSPSLSDFG